MEASPASAEQSQVRISVSTPAVDCAGYREWLQRARPTFLLFVPAERKKRVVLSAGLQVLLGDNNGLGSYQLCVCQHIFFTFFLSFSLDDNKY